MISGPRDLAAKLCLAFVICHAVLLAFIALPSLFIDLSPDRWPGAFYNSLITSEFRIDKVFYIVIAPALSVISLAAFWDHRYAKIRWAVIMLCFFGLAMVAIIYFGFSISNTQKDLWQLGDNPRISSFADFASLSTAFCIQNGTVLVAILAFAMGTDFGREQLSQLTASRRGKSEAAENGEKA